MTEKADCNAAGIPEIRTVLTVSSSTEGVRLYSRTSDGLIRELCLSISPIELSNAMYSNDLGVIKHQSKWFLGELAFQSHRDSKLCSLIDDSSCKSIFYQDTDGTIRERKYGTPPRGDTQTWQWHPTRFDNPGTLLGTSIAGVETGVNTSVVLFFQDDEGFLLYRLLHKSNWNDKVPRVQDGLKAKLRSGLAATRGAAGLEQIWLYYQNDRGDLCEYSTGLSKSGRSLRKSTETIIQPLASEGVIQSICAIRVMGEIPRIIIQNGENEIVDFVQNFDDESWRRGGLRIAVNSTATVSACAQQTEAGYCILLYWAAQDNVVHQRVWYDGQWFDPQEIANIPAEM